MSNPSQKTRQFVVAYDVASTRDRRRLARYLEGRGQRSQKSVFSLDCTQAEIVTLLYGASALLEQPGATLDAWPVHSRLPLPERWRQRRASTRLPDYWIV